VIASAEARHHISATGVVAVAVILGVLAVLTVLVASYLMYWRGGRH
jgi:hypothetical protein